MLRSQLTIQGMYHYNPNIFSDFQVPSGMDRDTMINEILIQCAELELIYPDYNILKLAIKNWTIAELPQWQRAYEDMNIEYNPIWNVDGTETIERELTNETKAKNIQSGKAYNQSNEQDWTERDKDEGEGEGKETEKITRTRGGNIGVTMTQQMLNADLDLLARLNPYQFIADSFKKRFCLLVY